ncbi:MAG TPA: Gfo/Idh/MocA family oxidoreductase [Xanthobacteraceae bacterium]|jgi:predicted dehydrogenase
MIGVGIVGCNYGSTVLLPAFRTDPRCDVVALAGTNAQHAAELARRRNVPRGLGDWRELVEDADVAAIAIAVPPDIQPDIARHALALGKPVFVEKPLAADLASAQAMLASALRSGRPTIIDFEFPELASWRRAKDVLAEGGLGRLRHVVVTWNVENAATRLRLQSWKTRAHGGGGVLGNFVCHCFHYLEWFCGPISGLGGRLFALPGTEMQTSIALALAFTSGAGGSLQMSCASYRGSGHRIELYGDDGTLVLDNPTGDYFRGFTLRHARRADDTRLPAGTWHVETFPHEAGDASADSRIAPVSRLVHRFLDACAIGQAPSPGFAEGCRVQYLIDAAERAHASGCWIDIPAPGSEERA